MTTDHIDEDSNDTLLNALAGLAKTIKPRLFAIYGLRDSTEDEAPDPYIGWGIDLGPDNGGALYWDNGVTHRASAADDVLGLYRKMGDVNLLWY